ncbi:hypothetical protein A4U49_04385 [Acidithiobacillus ferrivorans]|jgi:hypothetical protein|uniref:hypothetical protein n=1 Tax=Acidithiobacillus ferrivorans TaxID=160808 RepID=UPI000893573E|nr:hypothetical protein [Acidithiobacillus ferrivorans]OFA17025.1 hypothetical protein A4U49_04385 [Acidithiobacillus ferrivorans]
MPEESLYYHTEPNVLNTGRSIENFARKMLDHVKKQFNSHDPAEVREAKMWLTHVDTDPANTPSEQMPVVAPHHIMEALRMDRAALFNEFPTPSPQVVVATPGMTR